MNCKQVMAVLEERFPLSAAMEWDNVGLLAGREEKEIRRIYVALDVTEETIAGARAFGADLMLTHHPLLFSPVKKIHTGDFIGRRLISMMQMDLCYAAMHTNFDVLEMAKLNARQLGLIDAVPLQVTDREHPQDGLGRIGKIEREMSLEEFAKEVKSNLQIPDVRVYGDLQRRIKTVAVCGGSGKSTCRDAIGKHADVLVTGDIDYHTGLDAVSQGLAIVDAGHYGTEYGFISYMTEELKRLFPEFAIGAMKVCHPYQSL